mmetsp:Transcript_63861/g.177553  ORF Transcript_63861/g.177553 Transcript_63861/m.177553 type:complete len:186 (-) Transcript_63861:35-592(-)
MEATKEAVDVIAITGGSCEKSRALPRTWNRSPVSVRLNSKRSAENRESKAGVKPTLAGESVRPSSNTFQWTTWMAFIGAWAGQHSQNEGTRTGAPLDEGCAVILQVLPMPRRRHCLKPHKIPQLRVVPVNFQVKSGLRNDDQAECDNVVEHIENESCGTPFLATIHSKKATHATLLGPSRRHCAL